MRMLVFSLAGVKKADASTLLAFGLLLTIWAVRSRAILLRLNAGDKRVQRNGIARLRTRRDTITQSHIARNSGKSPAPCSVHPDESPVPVISIVPPAHQYQ